MSTDKFCLPATGFIANLKESDRDTLGSHGSFHTAEPGTVLIEQGKPHGKLFFAIEGLLEARLDDGSDDILLGAIKPGEWMGEVDLFDPSSAVCNVIAKEKTRYWVITREELEKFINKNSAVGSMILIGLASTLGRRIREVTLKHSTSEPPPQKPFLIIAYTITALSLAALIFVLFTHCSSKPPVLSATQIAAEEVADLKRDLADSNHRAEDFKSQLDIAKSSLNKSEEGTQELRREIEALRSAAQAAPTPQQTAAAQTAPAPQPTLGNQDSATTTAPASQPSPAQKTQPAASLVPYPPEVIVSKGTTITLIADNKAVGIQKLALARAFKVNGIDGNQVKIDIGGGTGKVPMDKTNFTAALAEANLKAAEELKNRDISKAQQPVPPPTPPTLETREITLDEIDRIASLVDTLGTAKLLKEMTSGNAKIDISKFTLKESPKWDRAASEAKFLLKTPNIPKDRADWLRNIVLTSEIIRAGRIDYVEAQIKQIDKDWLAMKTDSVIHESSGSKQKSE